MTVAKLNFFTSGGKVEFLKDVEFVWFDNKKFKFKKGDIVDSKEIPQKALMILLRGNYCRFHE